MKRDSGIFSLTDGDHDELEDSHEQDEVDDFHLASDEEEEVSTFLSYFLKRRHSIDDVFRHEARSLTPPSKRADEEKNPGRSFHRSKSLRSALKSPYNSQKNLSVRFADSLGLDLEHTRHIIQTDAERLDQFLQITNPEPEEAPPSPPPNGIGYSCSGRGEKFLVPHFSLPSGYNTEKLLRSQQVCLESFTVADFSVTGVTRVTNLGYEKFVHVRYTLDDWKTYDDVQASYIPGSSDGFTDKFVFTIFLSPNLSEFSLCQLAIRYRVGVWEYWDNFNHANYIFQCRSLRNGNYLSSGMDFF